MSACTPLLFKVLLVSVPMSLLGLWGAGLLEKSPLNCRKRFISLVMVSLLLLPLLVWLEPALIRISLPPPETGPDVIVSLGYSLLTNDSSPAQAITRPALSFLDLAMFTWLIGSLLGGLFLLWGVLGVRRYIRSSRPLNRNRI